MRDRIEGIVKDTDLTTGLGLSNFFWGDMAELNKEIDSVPIDDTNLFPVVCMLPSFISGGPSPRGRGVAVKMYNSYLVTLLFLTSTEFLQDQNTAGYTAVKAMEDLGKTFISKLMLNLSTFKDPFTGLKSYTFHGLNPYEKKDMQWFFNVFDANVNGVGMTIEIHILENLEDCQL